MSSSVEDELEWEEWDETTPFWTHCVAGSIAGVAEHTLVYPFDTCKTYLQACANCPHNHPTMNASSSSLSSQYNKLMPKTAGMWTTMRHIVSQAPQQAAVLDTGGGMARLWRGACTIAMGCIPAHALYFSSYEAVKVLAKDDDGNLSARGGMMAGAAASMAHDCIMAPMDTIKQRLQLGHYQGMSQALHQILKFEGLPGLFRSFPITLATNIPYGMVMVSTMEVLKARLGGHDKLTIQTCLAASSVAAIMAAATTTPLDRCKTFLQTQHLQPACRQGSCPKISGKPIDLRRAFVTILHKEGFTGLFRGMVPRVISHTPAVAISWTTYEAAKEWLTSTI